jgi:hypothetical protein
MLIDSLYHEFVECCPVWVFEIVAIHGCSEDIVQTSRKSAVDLEVPCFKSDIVKSQTISRPMPQVDIFLRRCKPPDQQE